MGVFSFQEGDIVSNIGKSKHICDTAVDWRHFLEDWLLEMLGNNGRTGNLE